MADLEEKLAQLREYFDRWENGTSDFNVGDIVTPRKGAWAGEQGQPYIVLSNSISEDKQTLAQLHNMPQGYWPDMLLAGIGEHRRGVYGVENLMVVSAEFELWDDAVHGKADREAEARRQPDAYMAAAVGDTVEYREAGETHTGRVTAVDAEDIDLDQYRLQVDGEWVKNDRIIALEPKF